MKLISGDAIKWDEWKYYIWCVFYHSNILLKGIMTDHVFVITVYKESPYLEQCIHSLLNQTVKSDVLMATSTPTAYSRELAEAYSIPYFVNDNGETDMATNWNFGLSKGTRKLVTLAHQDDVYDVTFAETVITKIEEYGRANISITFTDFLDTIDSAERWFSINALIKKILLSPFLFSTTIKLKPLKRMILALGNPICCPTVTFNMEVLADFKFRKEYSGVLDWFAWYELASKNEAFLYIDKKLIRRRLHRGSGTIEMINTGSKFKDELRVFEYIWGRRIGLFICRLYFLSYKDNIV